MLAGEDGLDREVSWPVVLRVRPPAFDPLSGHELALVSTEALHLLDETLSLAQLIVRLAERGVAGLVVVGEVDAVARERAEAARLPLLWLPDTLHVSDLGQALSRVIGEQRTRHYQLGLDVQHQLAEVSMAGRGLGGIVERVAELSDRPALLVSPTGETLGRAAPSTAPFFDEDLASERRLLPLATLREHLSAPPEGRTEPPVIRLPLKRGVALVAPVVVRAAIVGYLLLLAPTDEFGEDDQIVITRGSMVCALELSKQEAVTEAERRLRGDFFDDLLDNSGAAESAEALINRGRHLGYDLQRTYLALAIAADGPELVGRRSDALIERVAREVSEYLTNRRAIGLVAPRRQAVALFFASEANGDLSSVQRFAEELRDYLAGPLAVSVSIGLGRYHPGIAGLRAAYREAEQACQIGREFFGPGQVTAFADLGVYRLLYAFRQSSELTQFCEETLAPLTDYDAKNGMALVETLEVFFRCDASLREAADALYLHRNSLAYRLRRISEITGLDLDNLEDRFRLQLALKGLRLVRAHGPTARRSDRTS